MTPWKCYKNAYPAKKCGTRSKTLTQNENVPHESNLLNLGFGRNANVTMSTLDATEPAIDATFSLHKHGQESLDSVLQSNLFVNGVQKTFPVFGRDGTSESSAYWTF